ncbi:MAG: glycosyltransferase, partial [Pseudomonadota bacterium]|nr:glycosyltransferase [Pseudomonadota bacterium]
VVLAVGRWVPKKGLDTLAAAAILLGERARVRMISDAPALPGVDVRGLRPRAEVAAELATATIFALPCRRAPDGDQDGIPVALLEAMAAGLPVVTTAVSGIPEIVDKAVGWIVPPDNPVALAAALREALDDPAEAARRGAAGRARLGERGFLAGDTHGAMARLLGGG